MSADWALTYQRTLSGAAGSHLSQFLRVNGNVPLFDDFGIGAEYWLFTRDSNYRTSPMCSAGIRSIRPSWCGR